MNSLGFHTNSATHTVHVYILHTYIDMVPSGIYKWKSSIHHIKPIQYKCSYKYIWVNYHNSTGKKTCVNFPHLHIKWQCFKPSSRNMNWSRKMKEFAEILSEITYCPMECLSLGHCCVVFVAFTVLHAAST